MNVLYAVGLKKNNYITDLIGMKWEEGLISRAGYIIRKKILKMFNIFFSDTSYKLIKALSRAVRT